MTENSWSNIYDPPLVKTSSLKNKVEFVPHQGNSNVAQIFCVCYSKLQSEFVIHSRIAWLISWHRQKFEN